MSEKVKRLVERLRRGRIGIWIERQWLKAKPRLLGFWPGPRARRGAVAGAFTIVLLYGIYSGVNDLRLGSGIVVDALVGLAVIAFSLFLTWLLIVVGLAASSLVARLPRIFPAALAAGVIVLLNVAFPEALFWHVIGLILGCSVIGGGVAVLTSPDWRSAGRAKRWAVPVLMVAAAAGLIALAAWLASRGTEEGLVTVEPPVHNPVAAIEAADPSLPGPYRVLRLTYGNGEDRRPEFGAEADLITPGVDGKAFVGKLSGWKGRLRNRYWGYDRRALALNGRVWYPDGEGPWPLVLCVHGNHSMRDYSDPGYAYLGELLASKGYIFVSVDENFINGDWSANYSRENDARGWLLLEHLKVWREWNAEEGHLFAGRVDLDRLGLIGHSRGGEAVAVAAAFNRLNRYPDDASVLFDYDFNLRVVIGIAPVDGQYTPMDQPTPLEDVNYLLLHGSHDGDVSSFSGDRQYKRIAFSEGSERFKTSLYIYRANHGQFNTVWGDTDWGMPGALMLNRAQLMPGDEQRRIAKVYIGAFLDLTMKDETVYRPLFRDWRAGEQWLPETLYVNRFEDAHTRYVCDYDEDIDLETATEAGVGLRGENLANWREEDLGYRGDRGDRMNQAVYLGWRSGDDDENDTEDDDADGDSGGDGQQSGQEEHVSRAGTVITEPDSTAPAVYTISLPGGFARSWDLDAAAEFVFAVAESDESPARPDTSTVDLTPREKRRRDREERRRERAEARQVEQEQSEEQSAGPAEEESAGRQGAEAEGEEGEDEGGTEEEESGEDDEKPQTPLDFTLRLTDAVGRTAELALSEVMRLLPPLKATFTRHDDMEGRFGSPYQLVLQTVAIPLERFAAAGSGFDPRRLVEISFVFDRSPKGLIVLDEIGFRTARER